MFESIQKNVTWRAIPIAAVIAGTVFLLVNVIFTPIVLEADADLILRYFASIALGDDVLLEGDTTTIIVGVVVHYILSFIFAFITSVVVHRWGLAVGIIGGAILGLCFYVINLYLVVELFEWMFAIRSDVFLAAHILFGALAGGVYEMFDHFDVALEEDLGYEGR
jgi:hypothetical protein